MREYEILMLLREAYRFIGRENRRGYQRCMEQAKAAIDAMPKSRALRGEWLLISAISCPSDLDRLCVLFREVAELMEGHSRVLPHCAPLYDDYGVFAVCNKQPGHAEENIEKLAEAVRLFYGLTGGAMATDVCYRAQVAHYQGKIAEARTLAKEAFELSQQQGLVALWAAYILADLAKHQLDSRLWSFAYGYINAVAKGIRKADRCSREQALMFSCLLDMSLGLLHSVPDWVKAGDFGIISTSWGYELVEDKVLRGTLVPALVARLEYYCYCAQPVKALNIADTIQKVYGMGNVELDAYLEFFRAGSYAYMGDADRVRKALMRAVELLAPDGLWLIAAEFEPSFGELLHEVANRVDREGAIQIRKIGAGFWEKLAPLREELLLKTSVGLTKREREVAALLVEGRTNSEIAAALSISERTVKGHLTNIFRKYNISRRTQVAKAMEQDGKIELAAWIT
ncbi:LuxR C-terminal-related transcriptional regulator [Clostridium sp. SL.3.18]|mgnify:FL=1|nr:LuxR C-terminal-related transcriptional regulator [Clostridium sp. SL.3.18]